MSKPWDSLMKLLVGANPQHFVSLLLGDAQFAGEVATELNNRTIYADLLYKVIWNGQEALLHVEFQRRRDGQMGRRLWEYNAQASFRSGLPVCSFVVYLRKDGNPVQPPYRLVLPNGEASHVFYYVNINVWQLAAQALKRKGREGLLPLLPLTADGLEAPRETVEDMIGSLQRAGKEDLLPLGYAFAALIFEKQSEKKWLKRRFDMLHEILEESWAYQEMVEKGLAQGLEKGLKEGMEKGMEKGLKEGMEKGLEKGLKEGMEKGLAQGQLQVVRLQRTNLLHFVQARFPELITLAEQSVQQSDNPEVLQDTMPFCV